MMRLYILLAVMLVMAGALSAGQEALAKVLTGTPGEDTLVGTDHYDRLIGRAGEDSLKARSGSDHLNGGTGQDFLKGNSGNDHLWASRETTRSTPEQAMIRSTLATAMT
jgi:Ca2+-binding RTX toxin-like protein